MASVLWQRRILAHPQDVHCIVFHLVVLACYALAFWLWLTPERAHLDSLADRVAFCVGAGLLLGWISGVDVGVNFHNHTHRRIFRKPFLNRWFGRVWTFSGGWPSFYWNHAHVVVHHSNLLQQSDWTLPRRRADGSFESLYAYVVHGGGSGIVDLGPRAPFEAAARELVEGVANRRHHPRAFDKASAWLYHKLVAPLSPALPQATKRSTLLTSVPR